MLDIGNDPISIMVRPETHLRWASVRSVHDLEENLYRVKQFVYDWSDVPGNPTNLEQGWAEPFAPLERFEVRGRPAYVGKDFFGRTAGFRSHWLVHLEVSHMTPNVEPRPIRQFARSIRTLLESARPASGDRSKSMAARPFPRWSWTARGGPSPWGASGLNFSDLRWTEPSRRSRGTAEDAPSLDGFHLDGLGEGRRRATSRGVRCWLLRSEDLHSLIAVWALPYGRASRSFPLPKPRDFPHHWTGSLQGTELDHFYQPATGYGLGRTESRTGRRVVLMPPTLRRDPRAQRSAMAQLLRTVPDP